MESKFKTDTVLNDEKSEIKRYLCAFGPIGGMPQHLSNNFGTVYMPSLFRNFRLYPFETSKHNTGVLKNPPFPETY